MDSPTQIADQTPKDKPVVLTSSSYKRPTFKFSLVNPKILGALTILLLLIGGVAGGVYLTQTPPETVTQASISKVGLNFQPPQIQAEAGSTFSVDIFASANDNQIVSADFKINYDPRFLTLENITPGQFLPKTLTEPQIIPGIASISLGSDEPGGVTGNGVIATLNFKASSEITQNSQITFDAVSTKIKVLNREDTGLNTLGNAHVTITQPINATSSGTPLPQPSPTPLTNPETAPPTESTPSSGLRDLNNDGLINSVDLSILRGQPAN